ncbi:YDC1 [Candida pseudojiufengensis]|uniref:YDC1 n=1 Tax=Candida pseudojiufengensis TaxID=497109 RepID=UPI0022244DF9|nr:YDC1 [Candida pseudojiufengensis]KAI5965964.1 YDC1 [Candida pseudojiufengensis]
MLPFAWPYPPEQKNGFWGIPTSTIDWCEENYVVSTYIAEALNTVTNSVFITLALFAILQAYKNHLEPRFIFTAFGFFLVGAGSWMFHMTLQYKYQLLDELPMIYATCIPFWSVFSERKSKNESILIGIGIFTAANTLTAIYLYFRDPTIHQVAYAILNGFIIVKSIYLTKENVYDKKAVTQLNYCAVFGVGIFLFGYFLWNLDIHFCDQVRITRRQWGIPYGFILEGHGWWHIFTGTGVYFSLIYEEYLRCFMTGTEKFYKFNWQYGLPVVTCINPQGLERYRSVQKLKIEDEKNLKKSQ